MTSSHHQQHAAAVHNEHLPLCGLEVDLMLDLKLQPHRHLEKEDAEESRRHDSDQKEPLLHAPISLQASGVGRRGRRSSVSAHTSPARRAAMECVSSLQVSPYTATRLRGGSSGSTRPGYGRSVSTTSSYTSAASTGTHSVASYVDRPCAFGSATSGPIGGAITPPPFDYTESEAESIDADMLSDGGDAGSLVSGMRASRITTASVSVEASQCSSLANSPPIIRRTRSAASAIVAAPSSASSSKEASTPSRRNRKRRNSKLHASLTPLATNRRLQVPTASASAGVIHSASSTIVPPKYHPGQNKRFQNPAEPQSSPPTSDAMDLAQPQLTITVPSPPSTAPVLVQPPMLLSSAPTLIAQEVRSVSASAVLHSYMPIPIVSAPAPAPAPQMPPAAQAPQHPPSGSSRVRQPMTATRSSLISVLSCVLEQLFSNPNDTLPSDPAAISMFHTERIPSISIGQYLDRIAHYAECSDEALVMSFIHISRIYHSSNAPPPAGGPKPFQLNTLSIHRLLLVAIMASAKFYDDSYFNNSYFGKIGGVSTRELNALEVEFLALVAFELYIPSKIYRRFYKELTNPALHPTCTCAYQRLPALNWEEDLPASPAHDCDLYELMHGTPSPDVHQSGVRTPPSNLPSPITPLANASSVNVATVVGYFAPHVPTSQAAAPQIAVHVHHHHHHVHHAHRHSIHLDSSEVKVG